MSGRWPSARMARNVELGNGCRTVFLATLADLARWWLVNREVYSVLGYFCPGTSLLQPADDGNEECEWIAGPSVEAVVGTMLSHLSLRTKAEWREDELDGAEVLHGGWELWNLRGCPELASAAWIASFGDRRVSAETATALMLRSVAYGDQNELRVYQHDEVDDFIAAEMAVKADDGIDYYGQQNEGAVRPA